LTAAKKTKREALFEFTGGKPDTKVLKYIEEKAGKTGVDFDIF